VDEPDPPLETYKAAQTVLNPGDSKDSQRDTLLPTVSSNSSNPEHSQTLHAQVGMHRSLHTLDPSPKSSGVQPRPIPNVIIFGESGVGKSSIINMLDGDEKAMVSNKATGVTFSTSSYKKTIFGVPFRIFDTVGLNEGSGGTVKPVDAVARLYRLINHLGDGVNLLVYVMRSRIRHNSELNYKLFFEIFCNKKVPIVILITGLETMDKPMDEWWLQNEHSFDKYRMVFNDHACITSTKGKCQDGRFCYQDEYDQSKQMVERLISEACKEPWMIEPKAWFLGIVDKVIGLFDSRPEVRRKQLIRALRKCGGMSNSEAKAEAKRIEEQKIADEAKTNDSNRFPVS
jgi:GTP-binding protein EngB required for normal cell division